MLEELMAKMDAGFARMDEGFARFDQRFEQVDQRFEQVDRRLAQHDERFEKLEGAVHALGLRLEHKNDELKLLAEAFAIQQETTNAKIDSLRSDVTEQLVALTRVVQNHSRMLEGR